MQLLTPDSIPETLTECLASSALRGVRFTQEYPDAPVDGPTIVWRVTRRIPGKEGKETKKPRLRAQEPASPTTMVEYYGQWMTVIYQFDLIHTSNQAVDRLMRDFEGFVLESTPALMSIGVDSFLFDEQLEDYSLSLPKQIPVRSLRYEATMTVYRPLYIPRIRQIARVIAVNRGFGEGAVATAVTRDAAGGDQDTLTIPPVAVMTISDSKDDATPRYVAGVDYELTASDDGSAVVVWNRAGLRPVAGATYYVTHSEIDPHTYSTII